MPTPDIGGSILCPCISLTSSLFPRKFDALFCFFMILFFFFWDKIHSPEMDESFRKLQCVHCEIVGFKLLGFRWGFHNFYFLLTSFRESM